MKTIEMTLPIEIQRFVETLNRHGRAPLSSYWEICLRDGASLEDLKFPVSRVVTGDVEKKARRFRETGRVDRLSKGRRIAWSRFDLVVARALKKLGLVSLEKRGGKTFVRPLVGRVIFRVGKGRTVETIEEVAEAHRLIRSLRGSSKTRQSFEKRLRYEVSDAVEIVFPLRR